MSVHTYVFALIVLDWTWFQIESLIAFIELLTDCVIWVLCGPGLGPLKILYMLGYSVATFLNLNCFSVMEFGPVILSI